LGEEAVKLRVGRRQFYGMTSEETSMEKVLK